MYNIVFGEELQKVNQTEQISKTNKHQESWKSINEITGRKTTKRTTLKGQRKKKEEKTGMVILRSYLIKDAAG